MMSMQSLGWLFGLEGNPTISLSGPGVIIRRMTTPERAQICSRANDFFAREPRIWASTTERFPFVFEKGPTSESISIGGEDIVGVLLCLLSIGEVRTPIQWSVSTNGERGGASSSDIASFFYRLINGYFLPVSIQDIESAFQIAISMIGDRVFQRGEVAVGPVVLERLLESKAHTINPQSAASVVARAADTAMLLEYLFNENSNTEVGFRLGMSIAWLLEQTPSDRLQVVKTLKATYDLRSKRVHGGRTDVKPLKVEETTSVINADRMLRRAVFIKLLGCYSDNDWKNLFVSARLGEAHSGLDRAEWVP